MTDGILSTVEAWTGTRPLTCPWQAFYDPFVQRVLKAYRFYREGQIGWAIPNPSARMVAAIGFYDTAAKSCEAKRMEREAEERRRGS